MMKLQTFIIKAILRGILGLVAICFLNNYLGQYDIALGINGFNGVIIGLLGLPGFIMLYVLVIFDKRIF